MKATAAALDYEQDKSNGRRRGRRRKNDPIFFLKFFPSLSQMSNLSFRQLFTFCLLFPFFRVSFKNKKAQAFFIETFFPYLLIKMKPQIFRQILLRIKTLLFLLFFRYHFFATILSCFSKKNTYVLQMEVEVERERERTIRGCVTQNHFKPLITLVTLVTLVTLDILTNNIAIGQGELLTKNNVSYAMFVKSSIWLALKPVAEYYLFSQYRNIVFKIIQLNFRSLKI